jgi:hypothetical protein
LAEDLESERKEHETALQAWRRPFAGERHEKPLRAGIFTSDVYRREAQSRTYPPEKLVKAVDAARAAKADGIAIFSAASLKRQNLWPQIESVFR